MDRAAWLKHMHDLAEIMYDYYAPGFPDVFGQYENEAQRLFIQKLLARLEPGGTILSAACGAGRYDGILLAAGHHVVGTDLSAGMLAQARKLYPQARQPAVAFQSPDDVEDSCVYHYHPPLAQIHAWFDQAGFVIEEEGASSWYHHILARKK